MKINSLMNNQIQNINSNNKENTSFKGVEKKVTEADKFIAQQVAKLSQTRGSQKLVDVTRKLKSAPARWCDLESVAVTLFYMWNTWKSEKIDEERKVPSMIQNGAVTIASSAAAAMVDSLCDPIVDKIVLKYIDLYNKNPDFIKQIEGKKPKDFYGAIKKLKSNTVFTAVVRFIIPVLMVPVVGKIVEKLNEKKKEQQEESKELQTQTIAAVQAQQAPQTQQAEQSQPQQVQNLAAITPQQNIEHHDDDDDNHDNDDYDEHDDYDDNHDDDDDKKLGNTAGSNINNTNGVENKFKTLFA